MWFKQLDWDSKFFNYKVAMIDGEHIGSLTEMRMCLAELKEQDFKLAYIFVADTNIKLDNIARLSGGFLADKKTRFSTLSIQQTEQSKNILSYTGPVHNIRDLAIESGIYSRFNVDKNFRNKEFERLYTQWITRSVSREIADEVLIYKENESIAGLVTLKATEAIGQIGLIAVSMESRGKGIAQDLMHASHNWYSSKKLTKANVVTQGGNIPACKFYEKCGYHISEVQHVYHFWLNI